MVALQKAVSRISFYLARRDYSEKELRERLGRSFEQLIVNQAIEKAQEYGWIADPVELAKRTYESLNQRKKGYNYIKLYLIKKGLPEVKIRWELELKMACTLLQSRIQTKPFQSYEDQQKLKRFLLQRGFLSETIQQAFEEVELPEA